MATTTMTLVDGSTTIPLSVGGAPNPNAVVVKTYDLGFPTPRDLVSDRPGQSGSVDLTALHGTRIVKLDVSVVDMPGVTRHQTLDLLRAACHPSHRPLLYVQCAGWAQQRVFTMRGQPLSCVIGPTNSAFVEASLVWVVPSGAMTSAASNTVAIDLPVSAAVGMTFPTSFPLSWTPGNTVSIATVTNAGTEPTSPTWIIYGAANGFGITNNTTGQTLVLNATIADGHYVVVNVAKRTAYLDGDPSQSLYGTIDFTVSSWWTLAPGVNNIVAVALSSDLAAQVYFTWYDQWI